VSPPRRCRHSRSRRGPGGCAEYRHGDQAVVIVDFQAWSSGSMGRLSPLQMETADIAGEFVEMLVPSSKRWATRPTAGVPGRAP